MAGISFLDKLSLNKNKTWHKLPHSENWWKLCMPWMPMQIRFVAQQCSSNDDDCDDGGFSDSITTLIHKADGTHSLICSYSGEDWLRLKGNILKHSFYCLF